MKFFASPLKIYLAGADDASARLMKEEILESKNYLLQTRLNFADRSKLSAEMLEKGMQSCDVALVNLTPWDNTPSLHVQTALETGFLSAVSKRRPVLIIGYYDKPTEQNFAKRIIATIYDNKILFKENSLILDDKGILVESFGLCDNIMIAAAIEKSGGKVFSSFAEAITAIPQLWQQKPEELVARPKMNACMPPAFYLAGPGVFYPDPKAEGARQKEIVAQNNCIANYPLDNSIEDFKLDVDTALRIGIANENMMERSNGIFVNAEKWHNAIFDVGTAFELGYMRARQCLDRIVPIINVYGADPELTQNPERYFMIHRAVITLGGKFYKTLDEAAEEVCFEATHGMQVAAPVY